MKIVATSEHVAHAAKALYPDVEVEGRARVMPLEYVSVLQDFPSDVGLFLGPESPIPQPAHFVLAQKQLEKGYELIVPLIDHWVDPVRYFLGMIFFKRTEGIEALWQAWAGLLDRLSPWDAFNEALMKNPVRFWPAPMTWWRQAHRNKQLSVVIPCYEHEELLPQAVKSSLGQVEYVIVVDDGSPAVVSALQKFKGQAVYVVQHEQNKGLPTARNSGFRVVTTNLVCTLDADDLWERGRLKHMVTAWKPMTWVVGDVYLFGDVHRRVKVKVTPTTMRTMQPAHPAILLSRDAWVAVGGYDESIKAFESWDFCIRLLQAGFRVSKVDEVCVRYRKHKGQGMLSGILANKGVHIAALKKRNPGFWRDG